MGWGQTDLLMSELRASECAPHSSSYFSATSEPKKGIIIIIITITRLALAAFPMTHRSPAARGDMRARAWRPPVRRAPTARPSRVRFETQASTGKGIPV